ncbi:class I SAM-dependent methyltransferase [Alkalicoccus chagannorensis]
MWKSYEELAWIEPLLQPLASCRKEAEDVLRELEAEGGSILHFGCGAGCWDAHWKQQVTITGVDLSRGMLQEAKKRNPELRYMQGDMRSIQLEEVFDAVVIPDALQYMTTVEDIRKLLRNCRRHLKDGGRLLLRIYPEETYENRRFSSHAAGDPLDVTVFEEHYRLHENQFEALYFYVIRLHGSRKVEQETHILGLFPRAKWADWLHEAGFSGLTEVEVETARGRFLHVSSTKESAPDSV